MRFTEQELACLDGITGKGGIFGIALHPPKNGKEQEEWERILEGFLEKGILRSKQELSKAAALPLRTLEEYKESREYLILNHLHVALSENGKAVILIPVEGGYELCGLPREALMYQIVKETGFLRGNGNSGNGREEELGFDPFLEELSRYGHHLMTGQYRDRKMVQETAYYGDEGCCYAYDMNRGIRRSLSPREARLELLALLGIPEERSEMNGKRDR